MHGHQDLTVGSLAQRAAVLALHADGVRALLGQGDVIKEEDSLGAGEGVREQRAVTTENRTFVPGALVDELLEGLFGVLAGQALRQTDAAGERPNAFSFAVEPEPLPRDPGPAGGAHVCES